MKGGQRDQSNNGTNNLQSTKRGLQRRRRTFLSIYKSRWEEKDLDGHDIPESKSINCIENVGGISRVVCREKLTTNRGGEQLLIYRKRGESS